MRYFRHFSNASDSRKLQDLRHSLGIEGYGRYWLFLELVNDKFDGASTTVELHFKELSKKLETRLKRTSKTFIDLLNLLEIVSIVSETDTTITLSCPILLELMDRDSKYNSSQRGLNASKNKREKREEEGDKEEEGENGVAFSQDPDKVNFSQVAELFNQKLAGERIAHENFLQSGDVVKDFVEKQKEFGLYSLSNWEPIFSRAKTSSFITKKLGVKSHFAWLLREDNLKRLIKGDFDDKKNSAPTVSSYKNKWEAVNG